MTLDDQIETFLRHHTFPYSNRKAAKAELSRIIEGAVQAALFEDYVFRCEKTIIAHVKDGKAAGLVASFNDGSNISYSFGYGPGG